MVSPDGHIFIVNIPKNASSYMHDWAKHHGWRTALAQNCTAVQRMYVLLRDPMERWVSGIAQYIKTYVLGVQGPNGPVYPDQPVTEQDYIISVEIFVQQYNDLVERLIVDNAARFDDHVWPQYEIIKDILPGVDRHYFRVDHDMEKKMRAVLGWGSIEGLDRNSGSANPDTRFLQDFFRQRLIIRPELSNRIQRHYLKDYELLAHLA